MTITEFKVPQVFVPEKYPDSDEAPDFVPNKASATLDDQTNKD